MPLAGKRVGVVAARLLGQQHRQAPVAGLVRIGARQQRHQVGAHRMGDPGLGAVDDIIIAVADRARAQAREVGAGVGLGEDGGRQDLAAGDLRQEAALLRLRAAAPGSARRRSPSACRASRRRYSRATAPRRRRTSPPCRARGRRIPRGW